MQPELSFKPVVWLFFLRASDQSEGRNYFTEEGSRAR